MSNFVSKRLLIKLGTQCNLGCTHCHQVQKNSSLNPDLIPWIQNQSFDRITFSGGEPLMYFPLIRQIMETLGKNVTYRMMTNGTLLTKNICDYLGTYPHIVLGISFDGFNSGRDESIPIKWKVLKDYKHSFGISSCFSNPNKSFQEVFRDIHLVHKNNGLPLRPFDFYKINFLHQTADAPNIFVTKAVADKFILESTFQVEKLFYCLAQNVGGLDGMVQNLLSRWYKPKSFCHGCACCNENMISVNIDGTFSLCPYGKVLIGDIKQGIDWNAVETSVPKKCRSCEFWKICSCSCVANVTGHECYINRKMIPAVAMLARDYRVEEKLNRIFKINSASSLGT